MWHFSQEFAQTLHTLQTLDTIGVKTASVDATAMASAGVCITSSALYDVLVKKASEEYPDLDRPLQVEHTVVKMASLLGKERPRLDTCMKIAAAVAVDELLCNSLNDQTPIEREKLAQVQAYGREFLLDLLRMVV